MEVHRRYALVVTADHTLTAKIRDRPLLLLEATTVGHARSTMLRGRSFVSHVLVRFAAHLAYAIHAFRA